MNRIVTQPLFQSSNEAKQWVKKLKSTSNSTLNIDPIKPYELAQKALRAQQKKAFKEMKQHLGNSLRLSELNRDLAKDSSNKSSMNLSSEDMHEYFAWGRRNSGGAKTSSPLRHASIVEHENEEEEDFEGFSICSSVRRDLQLLDEMYDNQDQVEEFTICSSVESVRRDLKLLDKLYGCR